MSEKLDFRRGCWCSRFRFRVSCGVQTHGWSELARVRSRVGFGVGEHADRAFRVAGRQAEWWIGSLGIFDSLLVNRMITNDYDDEEETTGREKFVIVVLAEKRPHVPVARASSLWSWRPVFEAELSYRLAIIRSRIFFFISKEECAEREAPRCVY